MPDLPRTALLAALLLIPSAHAQSSSIYTDLRTGWRSVSAPDGSGQDIPQTRSGLSAYTLHKTFSAAAEFLSVEGGGRSVSLTPASERCDLPRYGDRLEWRLKAGRPVAVIVRVRCFEFGPDGTEGMKLGEFLLVRGLGSSGFGRDVDARTRNANEAARRVADAMGR